MGDFKRLYLKYKNKYLSLKNSINIEQKGGANYQNDTGHLPGIHGPPPLPPRASPPPIPPRAAASPTASPVARLPTGPTHTTTNNYIDPYSPLGYNPLGYNPVGYNPGYRKKIYYDYDRRDDDYYDDYDDYDDDYDKPRRRRTSRRKTSRKTSRRKSTKKK